MLEASLQDIIKGRTNVNAQPPEIGAQTNQASSYTGLAANLGDVLSSGGERNPEYYDLMYKEGLGEKAKRYGATAVVESLGAVKQIFGTPVAGLMGYLNAQNTNPAVADAMKESSARKGFVHSSDAYIKEIALRINEGINSAAQNFFKGGGETTYGDYIKQTTGKSVRENLVDMITFFRGDTKEARKSAKKLMYGEVGDFAVESLDLAADPTNMLGPMAYGKRADIVRKLVKGLITDVDKFGRMNKPLADRISAQSKVLDSETRTFLKQEKIADALASPLPFTFKDFPTGARDTGGLSKRLRVSQGVDEYTKWRDTLIAESDLDSSDLASTLQLKSPNKPHEYIRDDRVPRPPAPSPVEIPLTQEAQAISRSGGGVKEFLAKVREQQGLPPVDWTGSPSGSLAVGQKGRLFSPQGTKLQRGEIFEAARKEFGDQEAVKAARLIEQVESEIGVTGAPLVERGAETLGAKELVGKVEQAEKVYAVPTYVDHVNKSKPPVQYYEIKGGPKDGSSLTKEQLDRLGIKIVEPKVPKVKAPEGVVVAEDLINGKSTTDELFGKLQNHPLYKELNKLHEERLALQRVPINERDAIFDAKYKDINTRIDELTRRTHELPESKVWMESHNKDTAARTGKTLEEQKARDLANKSKWNSAPQHGTDIEDLESMLNEGLRGGSALDYTPNKEWVEAYPVKVTVPSAKRGMKIEHNDYYKSANTARVARVEVDMDQYSAEATQKYLNLLDRLKKEHPDVEFIVKGEGVKKVKTPKEVIPAEQTLGAEKTVLSNGEIIPDDAMAVLNRTFYYKTGTEIPEKYWSKMTLGKLSEFFDSLGLRQEIFKESTSALEKMGYKIGDVVMTKPSVESTSLVTKVVGKGKTPKGVVPAEQTLAPKESALQEGTDRIVSADELAGEEALDKAIAAKVEGSIPASGLLKVAKPGEVIPGYGKIVSMDVVAPAGKVAEGGRKEAIYDFTFEDGRRVTSTINKMTARLNAAKAPSVNTDFLGVQTAFEKVIEALAKLKPKTPFQYFPPDPILFTPDWDKIAKQRKKGSRTYPPVIGVERNVLMQANELETRTGIGMSLKKLMQNPIRLFEEMGRGMKELFYYPIKDAEHNVSLERVEFDKWLRNLRQGVGRDESKRIGTYAIAQQENGLERLKLMGVDNIPVLSAKEQQVYEALRTKFDEFYSRINQARALSGLGTIGKIDNYFTFMNDFARLEDRGNLPFRMTDSQLQKYIHPKVPAFGYAKHRADVVDNPLELDAFRVMENYGNKAIRHIHVSPVSSKLSEMLGTFTDPISGKKWMLSESAPNTARVIQDWLDYQNGVQKRLGSEWGPIERMLTTLNRNIPFAMLGLNLKSAAIQFTTFINTATELGPVNALKGVKIFMLEEFGHGSRAIEKSKVLLGREYDVAIRDLFNELRSGTYGQFQQAVGKLALKPLQYFDMLTAKATWYGAYEHGKNGLKLAEEQAIRYADDVVVRTQGSGARSDVAAMQRTSWGKSMMMFQTFVINDWNFIMKDVMGFGSPNKMGINRLRKVVTLMVGSWLTSALYEDLLGIQSPLARPTAAIQQAYDEGGGFTEMAVAVGKEMLGQAPFIGGPMRMSGKEGQFGGPITDFGGDIIKTAKDIPRAVDAIADNELLDDSLMRAYSLLGRGFGIPGTWQVQRFIKRSKQGAEPWQAAVGVPPSEEID